MNKIKAENLELALMDAIHERENWENNNGYTSDSILLTGWKKNLEDLRNRNLTIDYDYLE